MPPLLGESRQLVEDPLPRPIVGDEVAEAVAFAGGVGWPPGGLVQPSAVLEEDVGRASAGHAAVEQVLHGHIATERRALANGRSEGVPGPQPVDPTDHRLLARPCVTALRADARPGHGVTLAGAVHAIAHQTLEVLLLGHRDPSLGSCRTAPSSDCTTVKVSTNMIRGSAPLRPESGSAGRA